MASGAYDLSGLRKSVENQYKGLAEKASMEGAGLAGKTATVVGRQLAKSGVKGNLAAAAQREGLQQAEKATADTVAGIGAESRGKLAEIDEQQRQLDAQEAAANTELLFKVLGGIGSLASNFIPGAQLRAGVANWMGLPSAKE